MTVSLALQLLAWYLWRRWTVDVRLAYSRCRADKGYISQYDHDYIRAGTHWALLNCKHGRRTRSNNGVSYCLACDKVFMAKERKRNFLGTLVGW
jgi:hypothetical protein